LTASTVLPEGVSHHRTEFGDYSPINEDGDEDGYKWPHFGDRVRVKIPFGKYRGKWLKGTVFKDCIREDIMSSPIGSDGVYVIFKEFIRGKRPNYDDNELEDVFEAHCMAVGRAAKNLKLGWKKW